MRVGAPARDRGPLRRFAEARGLVGGFSRDHLDVGLLAADGTPLTATFLPGPASASCAVLLAHGFAANRRKPAYAWLAEELSASCDVLTLDLRGHGQSGGVSTLGAAEHLDVAAGAEWLRTRAAGPIVLVGASMGATAVLHAAARARLPPAAVVTISAPAWFRPTPPPGPMQALDRLWRSPVRRAALRAALGIRVAGPKRWNRPPHPVELAGTMGVPLLAVHGEDDPYFPSGDATALATAGGIGSLTWHRPAGFGHAEDGFTAGFARELAAAIVGAVGTGRFVAAAAPPE